MITHMDESKPQNIQCNLKNGKKSLNNDGNPKEKFCGNSEQKIEESELTLECNLAESAKNESDNEDKNKQKLCLMARINFYGTSGEIFYLN